MAKEMQWKSRMWISLMSSRSVLFFYLSFLDEDMPCNIKINNFYKLPRKFFIFAQFLEKITQKQNLPKFWKNLPNFQKLPYTCSPARKDTWYQTIHLFTVLLHKCPIFRYRSGTVNSNTVNSKFHLIRSYCEIFFYTFPNIPCLKFTVNSNIHLIRSKTLPTNDLELTVPDPYLLLCVLQNYIPSWEKSPWTQWATAGKLSHQLAKYRAIS